MRIYVQRIIYADIPIVHNLYLEGGLVARQPKLPLKLNSRYSGRLTGHKISGPEPDSERL